MKKKYEYDIGDGFKFVLEANSQEEADEQLKGYDKFFKDFGRVTKVILNDMVDEWDLGGKTNGINNSQKHSRAYYAR